MSKATTVFNKHAAKREKKRYMSHGTKGLLAGMPAALVSTTVMFPADTFTTGAQAKEVAALAAEGHELKIKTFIESPKLIRRLYRGLPAKLSKTIPGMALTFATYGIGKDLLDKRYSSKK